MVWIMKDKVRLFGGRLLSMILLLMTWAVSADNVHLDIFGHLPSTEDVRISPNGSRLALIRTAGDERLVQILSLDDRKILRTLHLQNLKLRGLQWVDENHLLIISSSSVQPRGTIGRDTEWRMLTSYDVEQGSSSDPVGNVIPDNSSGHVTWTSGGFMNTIVDTPVVRATADAPNVYVSGLETDKNNIFKPVLLRFHPGAKYSSVVAHSSEVTNRWLIDQSGEVAANVIYIEPERKWQLSLKVDNHLKVVASAESELAVPQLVGLAPKDNAVWVRFPLNQNGGTVLKSVSMTDGTVSEPLAENGQYEEFILDRLTGRVVAGRKLSNHEDIVFFDSGAQEAWDFINSSFPGEKVRFVSATDDFRRMVITIEGKEHGYMYAVFDAGSYKFKSVGAVYDGLDKIAETTSLVYQSSDGLSIPAFLTLPLGREPTHLPLIVLPHGGPAAHDTGYFDWWAQELAAQGYAVLQPNFRGSDVNLQLLSAGYGEWGRKMQQDLSDGVRKLVKDGVVDAKRVCIAGASYGGYAALAGASFDKGTYRCAVSVSGISDLAEMRTTLVQQGWREDSRSTRYFDRFIGAKDTNDPVLGERSPAQHVEDVNIPVLLIHGKDDTVVPYRQSELMFKALKKAGKPVEFVTLKHEDHWLSNSDTRMQMLQAMVDFLLKNNPPN